MAAAAVLFERSPREINCLQLKDGPIHLIIEAIGCGAKPNIDDVWCEGLEAQCSLQLWECPCIDNGVFKRKHVDVCCNWLWLQFFVPHPLRSEIIEQLHSGMLEGHLGVNKTVAKIMEGSIGRACITMLSNWWALAIAMQQGRLHHRIVEGPCIPSNLATPSSWWRSISWAHYQRVASGTRISL